MMLLSSTKYIKVFIIALLVLEALGYLVLVKPFEEDVFAGAGNFLLLLYAIPIVAVSIGCSFWAYDREFKRSQNIVLAILASVFLFLFASYTLGVALSWLYYFIA